MAQQFPQETRLFFPLCLPQHIFCLHDRYRIVGRRLSQLQELHSQLFFLTNPRLIWQLHKLLFSRLCTSSCFAEPPHGTRCCSKSSHFICMPASMEGLALSWSPTVTSGRGMPARFRHGAAVRGFFWISDAGCFSHFPNASRALDPSSLPRSRSPAQITPHLPRFPRRARPPEVTSRKSLLPQGAGKQDSGAQQPVKREDTGIPGSGQNRALRPHPLTLSPHASWQVG